MKRLLVGFLVLILGCTSASTPSQTCIELCQQALTEGRDLSDGPCLSNEVAPDWVCDVAHNPRQAVDNIRENQCPGYGINATHFVEVDPECNFIKAI